LEPLKKRRSVGNGEKPLLDRSQLGRAYLIGAGGIMQCPPSSLENAINFN